MTYKAVIYTLPGCPFCTRAKKRLRARNIPYREIKVQPDESRPVLPDGRRTYTFPQIFLAVGGCDAMDDWLPEKRTIVRRQ